VTSVTADVSEERIASIIKGTRIAELEKKQYFFAAGFGC
jgi:hypothetical protein